MNYIIISHCDIESNSGIHVFHIASELIKNKVDCVVSVPRINKNTFKKEKLPFKLIEHGSNQLDKLFKNNQGADIIHAFTPREHVRRETERLSRFYNAPYIVHLEDNEEIILKTELGIDRLELLENLPLKVLNKHIVDWRISPRFYKAFLSGAAGITALDKKLFEFNYNQKPALVFWPGFDTDYLQDKKTNIIGKYKLPSDCKFLVYSGTVHDINLEEFESLLLSISELNRRGYNIRLIKTGNDANPLLKNISSEVSKYVINLSFVDREDLQGIVHLAEVLVQPGRSDDFNDYRFPSKLPEYFATGIPVILPKTNIGNYISDFGNGILLYEGHYREIADKVEWVLQNKAVAREIGIAGQKFAVENLSWDKNVLSIYEWVKQLISDYKPAAIDSSISSKCNEPKLIAFYLPQYHAIPENNRWWGKGFTEWVNVKKGIKVFDDHHQPRIPSELGYYNLDNLEIMKKQSELATYYGIFGFCYYHYWFGGKRLLEKPLEKLLASKEPSSPFCLCWANENWTRRWDGLEQEILMKQDYEKGWEIMFFNDLLPYLKDSRYIKVDGKPLVLLYRIDCIPDSNNVIAKWREMAKEEGFVGLHVAGIQYIGMTPEIPVSLGADASVEFPPHMLISDRALMDISKVEGIKKEFEGYIEDYKQAMINFISRESSNVPWYRGLIPSWDNTARRGLKSHIYKGANPELYKEWLSFLADYAYSAPNGQPIIFVNAWNEWAEGAYLEPDEKHGRQYLEATCEAMKGYIPINTFDRDGRK